jgi:CRISPR associated protein Cas1
MLKHPVAQSFAAGARALYLGAAEKKRVTCTDEALVVSNERKQIYRYPVNRVARVVSSTVVDWSGAALALCLRRGIGIAWVDKHGEPLGISYPQARGNTDFCTALEIMAEDTQGPVRYQHWLRVRRMDVLIRWASTQPQALTPTQWENTKREWVYGGQYTAHLPTHMRSLCLTYVGGQLARHGLPPMLWGPKAQRIDLDEDLCELLWAEMNLCTGSLPEHVNEEQPATALFERWCGHNASTLMLHIHSLQRTAMKALHA